MYIIGASGHARVIIDTLEILDIKIEGVFDHNKELISCLGYQVQPMENFIPDPEDELVIAIGNNTCRKRLALEYYSKVKWVTVVHPSATVSRHAALQAGSIIMAGSIIQANAKIGKHTIVNTKSTIDHDCEVGDFTLIAPNVTLCGDVKIGSECLIGAGAVLVPGVTVGDNCIIGAGSVVLRDVASGQRAYGLVK